MNWVLVILLLLTALWLGAAIKAILFDTDIDLSNLTSPEDETVYFDGGRLPTREQMASLPHIHINGQCFKRRYNPLCGKEE